MDRKSLLDRVRRVVIKVGTQVLTGRNNRLDTSMMECLVEQISDLVRRDSREVVVITSGAIAAGMQTLGWAKRPRDISLLQAAASVGQSRLMRTYERLFREYGIIVGQILLTRDALSSPDRRRNVRHTLSTLLQHKVIPIVNENDAVSTEEIAAADRDRYSFGDNDMLSALVSELVESDALILLSNVNGLHYRDPKHGVRTRRIAEVSCFGKCILDIGRSGSASERGTGGMRTKIEAARHVFGRGKICVIADGRADGVLGRIFRGDSVGTLFAREVRVDR